jgi:hypothetical protein
VGVGFLVDDARVRIPLVIHFDASEYRVQNIDSEFFAMAVATAERPEYHDTLAIAFGRRKGAERTLASLWSISGCEDPSFLGETEVDFEFRTPRAPKNYAEPFLSKRLGAKLVTSWDETTQTLTCVHYDGFAIRRLRAVHVDTGWKLDFDKISVHEDRDDFAWVEEEQ